MKNIAPTMKNGLDSGLRRVYNGPMRQLGSQMRAPGRMKGQEPMQKQKVITVRRTDGSRVLMFVTNENFWGYTGYTRAGELISAWADYSEAAG